MVVMRKCGCGDNYYCYAALSTDMFLPIMLFMIGLSGNIIEAIKTRPPDEIIAILDRGEYNKHHLPTHFALNATAKRNEVLRGPHGWLLILEHSQNVSYDQIRLVQRELYSGHTYRIILNRPAATELSERLSGFITYSQLNGIEALSNTVNSTFLTKSPSSSSAQEVHSSEDAGSKRESLRSGEIRGDPLRLYFINFLRKSTGVSLLLTEAKGPNRRSTIAIPLALWQNVSDILDEFVSTKFTAPPGPPTDVSISIYIEGMSSFRAQSMDFHVDIYLAEVWNDPRLRHNNKEPALLRDWQIFERLWHPDLYFANAKDAKYHTVTAQNFGVYIWPNGTIHLDVRVSLVVNCMMDLSNFPLDTQECYIRILSYAYDIDHLNITWKPISNITRNTDILLPDMNLVGCKAGYCDGTYAVGIWSCALASFKMKREIMHHILQSYIPTALIVVISWFSFWLDADSVPGRISLCITTLLTLATQAQAAKMSLPQVSYAKAIDVWMGVCMAFVFGVMIEFTVVNYISRRTISKKKTKQAAAQKRRRSSGRLLSMASASTPTPYRLSEFHNLYFDITAMANRQCESTITTPLEKQPSNGHVNNFGDEDLDQPVTSSTNAPTTENQQQQQQLNPEQQKQRLRNRKMAGRVDGVSRYLFPCLFVLFNAIYWPYYMRDREYVSTSLC